jgi:hypothetical protein
MLEENRPALQVSNPTLRKNTARNISSVYYVVCLFAPLLLLGAPGLATILHLAVPWFAILLVLWLPGDFTFSPDQIDSRLPLVYGMLPGVINVIAPIRATFLARWEAPWLPALLPAVILTLALFSVDRYVSKIRPLVLIPLLCSFYGYSASRELNVMLDYSATRTYTTKVIQKRFSRTSQTLTVEPWGTLAAPVTAHVDSATWERVNKSDPVCVDERPGAFGLAWFSVRECGT